MNELYLVTGGTGFLGSHIVSELIGENKRVRVLALPGDKSVGHLANNVEICYGDLCSEKDLKKFFQTDESVEEVYVLHVASMVTVNPDYSQRLIDINVNGTANIINMCKKCQAFKRLLYVSSTGAIPELKKGNKIKEVDLLIPEEVVGWYSKSKAMATNEVINAVKNDSLDAVVVFPSGIMGPVDWLGGETTKTIIKIINGEMPMGINGSFNLVDVRDLATGCIQALKKGKKAKAIYSQTKR